MIRRKVVATIVHNKRERDSKVRFPFLFKIVDMKLNLETILEIPAIWSLKIDKSTEVPWWPDLDKGGLKVQPVPLPPSDSIPTRKNTNPIARSVKLSRFKRGNTRSGEPNIRGTK